MNTNLEQAQEIIKEDQNGEELSEENIQIVLSLLRKEVEVLSSAFAKKRV